MNLPHLLIGSGFTAMALLFFFFKETGAIELIRTSVYYFMVLSTFIIGISFIWSGITNEGKSTGEST